jgi:hypothetical protein
MRSKERLLHLDSAKIGLNVPSARILPGSKDIS